MKVLFLREKIYSYYVDDEESDMQDVYDIFCKYFGENTWILEGSEDEIKLKLKNIMKKYKMDFILNRFMNSGLAVQIKEIKN
jgi:hypothetical protein